MPRQPTLRPSRIAVRPHYTVADNLRDLSCRDLCSEREKALLQNWHLYFFSGGAAPDALRLAVGDMLLSVVAGWTLTPAEAIIVAGRSLAEE